MTITANSVSVLEKTIHAAEILYDFTRIAVREFVADRLMLRSMALTFGILLSLLPLFAVLLALFKLLGGDEWFLETVFPAFSAYLAPGVKPVVTEKMTRLLTNFAAKTVGGVSFVLLIIGLHSIFASVEATFNLIWGGSPRGKFLKRAPLYWGLFLAIPLLLAGGVAFTTYLIALPLTAEVTVHLSFLGNLLRRAIPAVLIFLSLLLIYRYLPTAPVKWKSALFGAIIAGILYEISKNVFIFYAASLVRYDLLYGSVAILPMAMVWISISWLIVLFGVELAYVFQHFGMLKRDQKHVRLSRAQQDELALRLLLATVPRVGETEPPWTSFGVLAEAWELPPGAINEVVGRLADARLIQRSIHGGMFIKLQSGVENMTLEEIDSRLITGETEVWHWPADSRWSQIRTWIGSRPGTADESKTTLRELKKKAE